MSPSAHACEQRGSDTGGREAGSRRHRRRPQQRVGALALRNGPSSPSHHPVRSSPAGCCSKWCGRGWAGCCDPHPPPWPPPSCDHCLYRLLGRSTGNERVEKESDGASLRGGNFRGVRAFQMMKTVGSNAMRGPKEPCLPKNSAAHSAGTRILAAQAPSAPHSAFSTFSSQYTFGCMSC